VHRDGKAGRFRLVPFRSHEALYGLDARRFDGRRSRGFPCAHVGRRRVDCGALAHALNDCLISMPSPKPEDIYAAALVMLAGAAALRRFKQCGLSHSCGPYPVGTHDYDSA